MMSDAYLSARSAHKSFDGKSVLAGIDASVNAGDVVGLLGANGAGKTTLIEMLLGLTPPNSGSVEMFGAKSTDAPAALKRRVGFVPQGDELIGTLNGRQYLDLIASFYDSWDGELVERLVLLWDIDTRKLIRKYSVGQRQKLAIVAALAHRPDVLVLDEPVASLDPAARRQFLKQIVDVTTDANRAVVFSSHIVSDLERLANRVWILKGGRLIWNGELDALKESVIRVHLPSSAVDAARTRLRQVISIRETGGAGSRMVALRAPDEDWSSLEDLLGADARIERMNLEEIFVELHP